MVLEKKRIIVFFDGQCRLCTRFKNWIRKLDRDSAVEFINLRMCKEGLDLKFKSTDLEKEIHLVSENKIYKGYYAVKYLFLHIKINKYFKSFLEFPFVDLFGVLVYKLVSNNRDKLWNCKECALVPKTI